ncbi:hypothetical protein AB0C32_41130, partial [Streptosporangium sp. NPDC048865]
VFFAAVDVVYWYWSKEPVGTTAMAISVGFAFTNPAGAPSARVATDPTGTPRRSRQGDLTGTSPPTSRWPLTPHPFHAHHRGTRGGVRPGRPNPVRAVAASAPPSPAPGPARCPRAPL